MFTIYEHNRSFEPLEYLTENLAEDFHWKGGTGRTFFCKEAQNLEDPPPDLS